MKRLGLILAVLVLALAPRTLAQSRSFSKTFTQNLTGSAPTLATDGVDISNATGFSVVVSAAAAQTITGGAANCYYYGPVSQVATTQSGTGATFRWTRCPASLDFTPTTGVRDASSGDFRAAVGVGGSRIKYVPAAITVSSGTTVDVTISVRTK